MPWLEEPGGVRGHAAAAVDLLLVERARPPGRRLVVHLGERPREVDRRRPGSRECALGLGEVVAAECRERETVRGRDADRRGAAHDHVPDRVGHLHGGLAADVDDVVRQPALVEEDDRRTVLLEADDLLRLELDHGRKSHDPVSDT